MAIASIFTPAAQDQSIYYLSQIFPGLNPVLTGSTAMLNVIGSLFQVLNSVVLTVAGFMVTYTIILGLLATAHEGEFLGKKFDKLWTPVRIVLGVAGLVPMSSGYSGIQVIMMWVIVQGIGVADVMWTTTLNYATQYGIAGQTSADAAVPKPLDIQVKNAMTQLFTGLVCQESARRSYDGYFCKTNSSDSFCKVPQADLLNITSGPQVSVAPDALTYNMGPSSTGAGSCGSLKLCNQTTTECLAQQKALQQITLTVLGPIASQLVDMNYNYQNFYSNSYQIVNPPQTGATYTAGSRPSWITSYCGKNNISNCCAPSEQVNPLNPNQTIKLGAGCGVSLSPLTTDTPPKQNPKVVDDVYWPFGVSNINTIDFIGASIEEYNAAMQQAYNTSRQEKLQTPAGQTDTNFKNAQDGGWIYAGALYYLVAQANNAKTDSIGTALTLSGNPSQSPLTGVPTNSVAAKELIKLASKVASAPAAGGGTGSGPQANTFNLTYDSGDTSSDSSGITDALNNLAYTIMDSFQSTLTGSAGTNPLIQIQALGHGILVACEVTFWIVFILMFAMIIVGGVASLTVLGTGDPAAATLVLNIFLFVMPLLMAFLTMFVAIGGTLGVYVPLIPFVLFTAGAIGWFIGVIEAMVAGPLVALGILSPSANHHEILGKAEPALGLLFGLFLRPGLMIFGMILGMLLSMQVVVLINSGFAFAFKSTTYNAKPGLIEIIIYMGAYALLIISAMNKCFALIHLIPEKVLGWISIQGQAGGGAEQEFLTESKKGVEGAGGMVGSVAGGAESRGVKGGEQQSAKLAAQKKAFEKKKAKDAEGTDLKSDKDEE